MESIIVVGGGAAGMLAAGTAAAQGKQVILLEKNEKLGKKLYITGKGRCNITNTGDIEDLLQNITKNRNFLYSSFYSFTNDDILHLLHRYGVPTKVERGNRVFPISDKSSDVIKALMAYMVSHHVDIKLQSEVKDILYENNAVKGVRLANNQTLLCSKLIIATGGLSYPVTGSTGDGYTFAEKAGHHVVPLKPALVPLEVEEKWIKDLQGLSLKNVSLQSFYRDREIHKEFGEMIFTHFGISGPIVLSTSNYISKYLDKEKVNAFINLKPALDEDTLDKRIQRDFDKYSRKQLKNALDDLLPAKLIPVIIQLSGIPEDKFVNQINKEERRTLLKFITALPLTLTGTRPIQEAIISSGGIDVKEINPSTMESKKISGLYFAGEVLDVEGLTGGYNLQIAFSTGYLAGISV